MFLIGTERVGNPAFAVVLPRSYIAGEGKGSGGNCKPDHEKNCMVFDSPHLRLFLISVRPEGCCLPPVVLLTEYPACPFCYFPEFSS